MSLALNLVVRNETNRIARCLQQASWYCSELVVVDQDSDDDTVDIARSFGATILHDECRGSPEASRPLAAEVTKSDWIIYQDADEWMVEDAIPALGEAMTHALGVRFSIGDLLDGVQQLRRPDGTYHPNVQLRAFRKGLVDYVPRLHGRVSMKNHLPSVLLPQRPAIWNDRTAAEWEAVKARYATLETR